MESYAYEGAPPPLTMELHFGGGFDQSLDESETRIKALRDEVDKLLGGTIGGASTINDNDLDSDKSKEIKGAYELFGVKDKNDKDDNGNNINIIANAIE